MSGRKESQSSYCGRRLKQDISITEGAPQRLLLVGCRCLWLLSAAEICLWQRRQVLRRQAPHVWIHLYIKKIFMLNLCEHSNWVSSMFSTNQRSKEWVCKSHLSTHFNLNSFKFLFNLWLKIDFEIQFEKRCWQKLERKTAALSLDEITERFSRARLHNTTTPLQMVLSSSGRRCWI